MLPQRLRLLLLLPTDSCWLLQRLRRDLQQQRLTGLFEALTPLT